MDNQTNRRLERLRGQLVDEAIRKDDLLHQDVLVLSQSLDRLIVEVQTEKRRLLERVK
ncbi:aspartyl-phosphate phosphatase Spo0E family protein [Paenibacillus mendelii]|uniref:Aspartyl-phosphate phosphatase Spo0E family protein n=1 Tax=Paenibacillus mendelii TaxID=206163 RepID=A0ABV6JK70_9BACL|nr:aspartyl-phosphate phosphatase Spo0E family protein [Paenibacillus mendelii]MCQ6558101.1 aspartyl-phosphate phosphatase Spo0E family protein [Paenibacillus mendelii]